MSFIIDYDIIRGDPQHGVSKVRAKINEMGWQPFGELTVSPTGTCMQPIVRYAGTGPDGRVHFPSDD